MGGAINMKWIEAHKQINSEDTKMNDIAEKLINMKHTKKKRGCKRYFFFTDLDMEIDIAKNCGRQEKAFAILAIN